MQSTTIRIGGELVELGEHRVVMGILNATPDSFFSGSRTPGSAAVAARCEQLLSDGADWIDVGGYSSRPGCQDIPASEEWERLDRALREVRRVGGDRLIVSVDTFRADVARRCVEEWGVQIINDISGGSLDEEMWRCVADLKVGYVLMHMRGTPQTMTGLTEYSDVTADVISELAFKIDSLRQLGVADIIVDPGFGFAKNVEQNFQLLRELGEFEMLGCPVLAGLSRKSMIWRTLGLTPEESLNGTTALNMVALERGASILRVHDVKEARECVELFNKLNA